MTMPPDDTALAPQLSHHEIKMAQLQMELVHAMADRFETEVKFSIVKAQIIAEEARQARILELQQQAKNDQMRRNIQHLLSLRHGRKIDTTNIMNNGFTTSALVASHMPPLPFLDMIRRIPEVVVAQSREQLFNQYDPRYSSGLAENSSIEESTEADVAVGGWLCGENAYSYSTSKVEREGLDNDNQVLIKRRRVVFSSTAPSVLPSFTNVSWRR